MEVNFYKLILWKYGWPLQATIEQHPRRSRDTHRLVNTGIGRSSKHGAVDQNYNNYHKSRAASNINFISERE